MSETPSGNPEAQRPRLYGRAQGKPLSARQQALVDELLPRIAIPETPPRSLKPAELFVSPDAVWLEIGFGGGEHLTGQAQRNPQVGILGAEPFLDGVAKALTGIEEQGLSNIRLRRGDARLLVEQLVDQSVDRVFILFPDPWPKTRHRKRRLIQPAFLGELARVLNPGARLRFATDWADYAERALGDIVADGRFRWLAEAADDWRAPPVDHVTTRYQEKRLGDCAPVFLDFVFSP
jgi:tRNA (guanine-N7-)-methyltransferase